MVCNIVNMLLFSIVALLVQESLSQVCKTLSLEGGGSLGAYEAGAIWGLVNVSKPEDVTWNVVSGISAGALNSLGVLQYPMGQEVAMANNLVNLWLSLNGSSSVFNQWAGGYLQGLLFERGLLNTDPLVETLRNDFKYGIQRNVTIGSTNLDTGMFGNFNESVGGAILDAVVCSASPPIFFPPRIFEGYTWADGGCIIDQDVFSGINRCLQITNEANIIVDMIFDYGGHPMVNETKFKTMDVARRIYQIMTYDRSTWFTFNAAKAFPLANFRYAIYPSVAMGGGEIPLNFTKANIENEINQGIKDTANLLGKDLNTRNDIHKRYHENLRIFYA